MSENAVTVNTVNPSNHSLRDIRRRAILIGAISFAIMIAINITLLHADGARIVEGEFYVHDVTSNPWQHGPEMEVNYLLDLGEGESFVGWGGLWWFWAAQH